MSDVPRPLDRDAPPEPDPMIGRTLADRYRVDTLIARGGMARVYRARDGRLDRDVAIKILSPPYADDTDFTARFLGEARSAASISHPSLVHVYDSGSDGAAHFIVMELLDEHRSLRQELDARGRLPRDDVLRIGLELLAGLRAVHERGLVHCDVKPGNVMLGPGAAKLIDFGIARSPHEATEGATSIGSLHFMSPEQLHGEALTPASDLFSLSVVLYEMLTGRVPFAGSTPEEVSAAHESGNIRPPSTLADGVPGRLDEAILQGLRRDPANRFRGARAMARALEAAEEEVSEARDDDTTVVRRVAVPAARAPRGGYVPPPAAPPVPARAATRPPAQRRPAPYSAPRRGGNVWGLLGTLLVLGAALLVVAFVVIPLLELGGGGGGGAGDASEAPAASVPVPPPDSDVAIIPDTVGMSTEAAIQAARDAGLAWTVRCNHDESQPEGIIGQDLEAGTEVARGSPFTMFSARISDCR